MSSLFSNSWLPRACIHLGHLFLICRGLRVDANWMKPRLQADEEQLSVFSDVCGENTGSCVYEMRKGGLGFQNIEWSRWTLGGFVRAMRASKCGHW